MTSTPEANKLEIIAHKRGVLKKNKWGILTSRDTKIIYAMRDAYELGKSENEQRVKELEAIIQDIPNLGVKPPPWFAGGKEKK